MRYIITKIWLLIKLSDYINIFNKEYTGKLPPNYLENHIIKINSKDFLYRPLYNLFIKKLEVLHQYLNKILEKK